MQVLNSFKKITLTHFRYIIFQLTFFLWILLDPSYWRWIWSHYIPSHSTSEVLALKGEKYVSMLAYCEPRMICSYMARGKKVLSDSSSRNQVHINSVYLRARSHSAATVMAPSDHILRLERQDTLKNNHLKSMHTIWWYAEISKNNVWKMVVTIYV